jgi:peptidoglycan/xylan/chitin deacetylase (PgdA/CDA1 family)
VSTLVSWKNRAAFQFYKRGYRLVPGLFQPPVRGPLVLLYHNVEDVDCLLVSKLGLTLRLEHFEEHLRYLTSRYQIIPVDDWTLHAHNPRALAITFDDGFRSVLTAALPLLERYQCPVKLYLTMANLDGINWMNKVSYLLNTRSPQQVSDLAVEALDLPATFTGLPALFDFIDWFNPEKTPAVVDQWFARCQSGPLRRLYLDEAEVRTLAAHPLVKLGSHTRNHYPLPRLNRTQLRDEVITNHEELNQRFEGRVHGFCMPFGFRTHLTREVVDTVRGVDGCVMTAYGGRVDGSVHFGVPEVQRLGVWGDTLGVLWYQMTHANGVPR